MAHQNESFLRGKIAEVITSSETVPFTKKVTKVPELTKGYITISPDTASEEIFYYDGVTGTPGQSGTITITKRGFDKSTNTTDTGNQKSHLINSEFKGALNHIIINNKADLDDAKFTGELRVPVFADATTRDSVITSPVDGLLAYLEDIEDFTSYKNGLWVNGLGGSGSATYYHETTDSTLTGAVDGVNTNFVMSNSPASPSAVTVLYNGLVQEYLVDYTITATTITFTTAPTSGKVSALYPDTPVGSGNAKTRVTTPADASNGEIYRRSDDSDNLYYKDNDGDSVKMYDNTTNLFNGQAIDYTGVNLTGNIDSATEVVEGIAFKATDQEAIDGVNNTKFITSKQAKDNRPLFPGFGTVHSSGTSGSTVSYQVPSDGIYTVEFSATDSSQSGNIGIFSFFAHSIPYPYFYGSSFNDGISQANFNIRYGSNQLPNFFSTAKKFYGKVNVAISKGQFITLSLSGGTSPSITYTISTK